MTSPNAYDGACATSPARSSASRWRCCAAWRASTAAWSAAASSRSAAQDARGTYALCRARRAIHLHDKDQPSFWENNYYAPGRMTASCDTSLGSIGCANGFEWGRTRTVHRMRGGCRLLAGGMHFPSFPSWRVTKNWFWDRDHQALLQYARETPPRMARLLGVPAVHPVHVGDFTMATMLMPGVPWPSICVGETAICDAEAACPSA